MHSILVGTASWSDKTLIEAGGFYPPETTTPEARLRYYASHFPLVEVDSSYYALPSVRNALAWVQRTPESFVFDVKAFRLLTQHQTDPAALPRDIRTALGPIAKKNVYYPDLPPELREEVWQRFIIGIDPLRRSGRLGVVLFQFPPWFVPSAASFAHLETCGEKMAGHRLAVEFRNKVWFDPKRTGQVWDFERDHGLAHVVVDEPQGFASSVPPLWEVTCPEVAVLRLHGRNRQTWEMKGLKSSAERFNYLYSGEELARFVQEARRLAELAKSVHVVFNNNFGNYAQRNAAEFRDLVENA